ncbi:conserved hypothetical protein [Desulfovibrionales bacterium]
MSKPLVVFLFRRSRAAELEIWRRGDGPGEFLYGLPFIDPEQFELSFVEGDDNSSDLRRRLCLPLEKWLERRVPIGFTMHIPWIHWDTISQADALVSTVDACGLPLGLFKRLGLLKAKLLYISQGLTHRIEELPAGPRKELFRHVYGNFLDAAERILVLGERSKISLAITFGIAIDKISVLPFGVDETFWTPAPTNAPPPSGPVLSIGSDPARDYSTLMAAVTALPPNSSLRFQIVTRLLSKGLHLGRVKVTTNHTPDELRELYRAAPFVIIPLRDVDQPSGQSATLQAMACGKAVILTRTSGLWGPSYMRHGKTCWLVPPSDPASLTTAICHLAAYPGLAKTIGKNARRLVETYYNQHFFSQGLTIHLCDLLNHPDR